jgi:hypothetical protein
MTRSPSPSVSLLPPLRCRYSSIFPALREAERPDNEDRPAATDYGLSPFPGPTSTISNNSTNVLPTAPAILCAVVTLVDAPFSIEESIGRDTPTASAQSADVIPATILARRTASPFDTMR